MKIRRDRTIAFTIAFAAVATVWALVGAPAAAAPGGNGKGLGQFPNRCGECTGQACVIETDPTLLGSCYQTKNAVPTRTTYECCCCGGDPQGRYFVSVRGGGR